MRGWHGARPGQRGRRYQIVNVCLFLSLTAYHCSVSKHQHRPSHDAHMDWSKSKARISLLHLHLHGGTHLTFLFSYLWFWICRTTAATTNQNMDVAWQRHSDIIRLLGELGLERGGLTDGRRAISQQLIPTSLPVPQGGLPPTSYLDESLVWCVPRSPIVHAAHLAQPTRSLRVNPAARHGPGGYCTDGTWI